MMIEGEDQSLVEMNEQKLLKLIGSQRARLGILTRKVN